MTMRQISKMVEKLRDVGYVLWSHDGNGSEAPMLQLLKVDEAC